MTISAAQKQQIIERRRRVADLRLSGVRKQHEVANRLGVSVATINRDFAALDEEWRERAAADIAIEKSIDLDRIDQMIKALWPAASSGHLAAVDRIVTFIALRAKMLGTEAPKKLEDTRTVTIHLLAETMAEQSGLDKDEVLAEAQRILAEASR